MPSSGAVGSVIAGPIRSVAVDVNSIASADQTMTVAVVSEPADSMAVVLSAVSVTLICFSAVLADILVRTQLFEPLGITEWQWVSDPDGREG